MASLYTSSGSEHEPDSTCLLEMMVAGFMDEFDAGRAIEKPSPQCEIMDACKITEDCQTTLQSEEKQFEILEGIISSHCPPELDLLATTTKCLETAKKMQQQQQPDCLKESVMYHLRNVGYDAAICKSRPRDNDKTFHSGSYDYMDVILKTTNSGRNVRLFVDLDFRAQFEIARPTREYSTLLGLLPKLYVGRSHKLQSIVKIMCEAMKNSLKKKGMHLPPWRKYKYMHSMWFGSYKRVATCNSVHDGFEIKMASPETSPTRKLMGLSSHMCNTIHAAGHVDIAEEYLNWGSPAGRIVLIKPSTGKLIISTLASALMEAGLSSLSATAEPERRCLAKAHSKVAIA